MVEPAPLAPRPLARFRVLGVSVLLAVATCLSSCTSGTSLPRDEALEQRLTRAGYSVQRGAVKPFRIEDCAELPSCFGNNATSPYAMWWLPPAPGTALPAAEGMGLPPDPEGRSAGWALRADEAVVYVGRTSPEAAYFSYAPYVFSRQDEQGERQPIFASITDAVNHTHFPDGAFDREIARHHHRQPRARGGAAPRPAGHRPRGRRHHHVRPRLPSRCASAMAPDADLIMLLQRFALFSDAAAGAAPTSTPSRPT
jgi:hypothetical protein